MIVGSIYVAFFASSFIAPFEAFLVTLGVPIAGWAGIFIADILLRRKNYSEADLYNPKGRYGNVRWLAIMLIVLGTAIGWGLVINTLRRSELAQLAGLPARTARPRRQDGRVGVREPRRAAPRCSSDSSAP